MRERPLTRRTVLAAAAGLALPAPPVAAAGRQQKEQQQKREREQEPGLQPFARYWYPDTLLAWSAATDPDLPFNRSTVPLASRFTPPPPNATARAGQARVSALVSFAPTSGNPSQGSATADYYALTHWAYLDELVFWGGSAGEGLILAPNAPVVDAAHRHGVPVLGTVFLPPVAYGGELRWTRDLVRRGPDGRFPVADKMAEAARAHGFDGWFLNAETGGGDARLAADMRDFVAYLRAEPGGLRVTWYDAMAVSGGIAWQNELNDHNAPFFAAASSMFLNFGWHRAGLAASAARAGALGRDRYELWAGADVEAAGWDTRVDWDALLPADGPHAASLGLYRPEWTWKSLPSPPAGGRAPDAFHRRDDLFWTGPSLDPARPAPGPGPWRAPAVSVADRSTVTSLPFATVFNTGHGLGWYDGGVRVGDAPWNHLGLQDRLPGRRWVVHTAGARPAVGFDFADAWYGGGSLLLTGELTAPTTLELYATRLPLSPRTVVELTYRTGPGSAAVRVELAAATAPGGRGGERFRRLPAGRLRAGGSPWTTVTVPLGALWHRGLLHGLGVRLTAPDGGAVHWRLGRLAVRDAVPPPPAPPGRPVVTAARERPDGTTELRLAWDAAPGPVRHYEVRQVLSGGARRFLGGTAGHAFYVPALHRPAGEPATRIEVRAVDELYAVSSPATTVLRRPHGTGRP
ncbi:hypothetical protein GCM10010218_08370 [Streptomyces mashuensis]|uniref:Mannosyl-glycoprotein endo-beta-N-acetylglucosaminidase n=1 Tax=Streptomyces mashuensis TaxID=33904 RepID=A0A919AXG3_9ACTN|nr:endo-beta-N-acetylglucosaminidase [Streptomyces mashuensis]GHF29526.1 hypothetical protein GCM10010218_08370 [Streptomyces mashuensis]